MNVSDVRGEKERSSSHVEDEAVRTMEALSVKRRGMDSILKVAGSHRSFQLRECPKGRRGATKWHAVGVRQGDL